jgi:Gpi18-like mannosyltransferase
VKKVSSSSSSSSSSLSSKNKNDIINFFSFPYLYFTITTTIFVLSLAGNSSIFPIHPLCSAIDDVLLSFHLIPKRGITLEAFIAIVCWSSTYLFIRRLWNPENLGMKNTFEKFSADSFFGGLAAGATVFLKVALTRIFSQ